VAQQSRSFQNFSQQRAEQDRYLLAAIVEHSNDAIISKTLDGVILNWNAAAEQIYGYSAEEVIGHPISILAPPDQPDEISHILEKINQGERVDHYETVRVRKDGRKVPVSLTISPIKDKSGKIIAASTIARDITRRKQAEAALRQERNFNAAVLDIVGALVIVLDRQGRIIRFNRACERTTGYSFEEIKGRPVWDFLLTQEEMNPVKTIFDKLLAGQFPNTEVDA
jgi:PAS domain S-box-containing protein